MADTKHGSKSKTVWMSVLQILAGLAAVAGLVGPVLGEDAAGWLLLVAGVAHVILRTVTGEPIRWRAEERLPPL